MSFRSRAFPRATKRWASVDMHMPSRIAIVVTMCALWCYAPVALGASRGGSGNVTTSGQVGPLRLHRSTRTDVIAFAGTPESEQQSSVYGVDELGYECSLVSGYQNCRTTFFLAKAKGTLIEFSTASRAYRALGHINIGASTRRAEEISHRHATSGCLNAIYILKPRANITLTLMIEGGRGTPGGVNSVSHVVGGHVSSIVLDGGSDAIDCA